MTSAAVRPDSSRVRPSRRKPKADATRRNALGYSFVLLPLAFIFVVLLGPILFDLWVSLNDWNLTNGVPPKFAGLDNYVTIFTDPEYLEVIGRSLVFVVISVALQVGGGIGVAVFIWRRYPNSKLLRAVLLLPMLVSEVVVGNIWRLMLNSDGGLVNGILTLVGLPPVLWLGPHWAFFSIIVADLWQQLPFVFLVIFAALQSVPDELLEGAQMDGAQGWSAFWNVVLPLIRPAVLLVLLFETLYALRTFSTVFILTQGGPAGATTLLGISIEQTALADYDVGLAAALSWVLLLMSLVLAIVYVRWLKRDPLS